MNPFRVDGAPASAPTTGFVSSYEDVTRVRIEDPGRFARLAATRRRRTVADTDDSTVGKER